MSSNTTSSYYPRRKQNPAIGDSPTKKKPCSTNLKTDEKNKSQTSFFPEKNQQVSPLSTDIESFLNVRLQNNKNFDPEDIKTIKGWLDSLKLCLTLSSENSALFHKKLGEKDKKNISRLDLLLRILSFDKDISQLHTLMHEHKIEIIPFVNNTFLDIFVTDTIPELHKQGLMPPKIQDSMKNWKTQVYEDTQEVNFFTVANPNEDGPKTTSVQSLYLTQKSENFLKNIENPSLDSPDISADKHSRTSKRLNIIFPSQFVLDGHSQTWIPKKNAHLDHAHAFSDIKNNVYIFIEFMEKNSLLKKATLKYYKNYFIVDNDTSTIKPTKYLMNLLYNYLDNLWFLDGYVNSAEKRNKAFTTWFESNAERGSSFANFVSGKKETSLKNLIDKSFFLGVFKNCEPILPQYQGKPLGIALTDWLHQDTEYLTSFLDYVLSDEKTKTLLKTAKEFSDHFSPSSQEKIKTAILKTTREMTTSATASRNKLKRTIHKVETEKGLPPNSLFTLSPLPKSSEEKKSTSTFIPKKLNFGNDLFANKSSEQSNLQSQKEEIERMLAALKNRQENLDARENNLAKREKEVTAREDAVAKREKEVSAHEKTSH